MLPARVYENWLLIYITTFCSESKFLDLARPDITASFFMVATLRKVLIHLKKNKLQGVETPS